MFIPCGIIPALVTPLTRDDEIDEVALRKLTHYAITGGVHGLFATGSQGEFWAFSAEEKQRVWEIVVDETAHRVPVYAGTAAVTTREAIQLTCTAEKVGADAVSVLTPYFISPNEEELYQHYKAIAASTHLPVLLYSNPSRTNIKLSVGLVSRLSKIENIVGVKDSSGDLGQSIDYITNTASDFSVLMGRDTLIFAALLHGAKGAIAATSNVAPALATKIYDLFLKGDIDGSRRAQEALAPLRNAFAWGTFPVVIKEALDIIGIGGGPCRAPVGPLSPEQHLKLANLLKSMKLVK